MAPETELRRRARDPLRRDPAVYGPIGGISLPSSVGLRPLPRMPAQASSDGRRPSTVCFWIQIRMRGSGDRRTVGGERDRDVAARRVRIGADLMGGGDQPHGLRGIVDRGQCDVERDRQFVAALGIG